MGQHHHLHQRMNELGCVVTHVGAKRDLHLLVGNLLGIGNHDLGSFTLGEAVCRSDHGAGNQTVAVIAHCVVHEAQLAGGLALAVKACVCIGGGLVGVVTALLVLEVARIIVAAVFTCKTLVAGQA